MVDRDARRRLAPYNVGRKGRTPKSPATLFVENILSDGQWHKVDDLIQTLLASGIPLPRVHTKSENDSARIVVREIAKKNSYEAKFRHTKRRRLYDEVRRSPILQPGAVMKTCAECGRPNLDVASRVRRIMEYRIPKDGGRGKGDLQAAKFKTVYLCIPCAETEMDAKGVSWRVHPPFLPSGSYGDGAEKKGQAS